VNGILEKSARSTLQAPAAADAAARRIRLTTPINDMRRD